MRTLLLFLLLVVAGTSVQAQRQKRGATQLPSPAQDSVVIVQMLDAQRQAWNRGDLDAFMQPYWQSDSLRFIGKSGLTTGWQRTLDNYRRGYPNREAMGLLTFTILQVQRLGPHHAFVIGKWHLTRTVGDVSGHFTLVLERRRGQWVITADHSS